MLKVRKVLCITVAIMMAAGLVLTGCTKSEDKASEPVKDTHQKTTTQEVKEELPPANLIYYYAGFVSNDDTEVFAKANEIIKKEINATVDFRPISIADYNKKVTLTIAAGEECDLSQSGGSRQPFALNVTMGAYNELDGLMEKHGQWFKQNIPAKFFEALKFRGKIYGVPNYQISYIQRGIMFQTDILDKLNIDVSNVKNLSDLTPIFEKVKASEKDMTILVDYLFPNDYFALSNEEYYELPISSGNLWSIFPAGISNDCKAVDMLKLPMTVESFKTMKEWNQKGFFPSDILTNSNLYQVKTTGKVFFGATGTIKPGGQQEAEAISGGKKLTIIPVSNERSTTGMIQATLTCINKVSKDPERAMMFLNLLNSNKELNNILFFGIEDKHYKKVGENRIEKVDKPAYQSYQWAIGTQFNAYQLPGQNDDVWELTKKKNENATPVGSFGFTFDPELVKSEIANINGLVAEYGKVLGCGAGEDVDKTLEEYSAKCYEAGLQKILDEMQKQLDEWKTNK